MYGLALWLTANALHGSNGLPVQDNTLRVLETTTLTSRWVLIIALLTKVRNESFVIKKAGMLAGE
jgi:hypothetical protein